MILTLDTLVTALLTCAPFGLAGGYAFTNAQSIQDWHIKDCERRGRFAIPFSREDLHSPQRVAEIRLAGFLLLSLSVCIFFGVLRERVLSQGRASHSTRPAPMGTAPSR